MSIRAQFYTWAFAVFAAMSLAAADETNFGEGRLNAKDRTVSFPAKVKMREGQVEYLVVHETGKIHESILSTTASAKDIHVAALLLAENANDPKLKLESICVSWIADGKTNRANVGEWIIDKRKSRPREEIQWTYRGSRVVNGVFLAERDGSIIAIMEDRDALIDQAAPDASDDENWEPNAKALPPLGAPVTVELKFAPSPAR